MEDGDGPFQSEMLLKQQRVCRLHIGASQLEYIATSASAVMINPSWVHLGDLPHFTPFYEQGTIFSHLKILGRRNFRRLFPKVGQQAELYQNTTFKSWVFKTGDTLDFVDKQFSFAYSEHFFEHLRFDLAIQLLVEIHRVLVIGGVLRIVVPDADYRTYQDPEPIGYPSKKLGLDHPNRHKIRWNVYMLTSVLELVGFKAVPLVYCDESQKFINRDPKEMYSEYNCVADPEFVSTLGYVKRPKSLIVDGLRVK